tara:strand:- start:829 stop:1866 length:1038 start_codon:yes stop_codon:yes gene_type:complete
MIESHQILITGAAGFIGYHLTKYFSSKENFQIVCLDNLNSYYDLDLKYDRLLNLGFKDIKNLKKTKSKSFVIYSVKNEKLIFHKQDLCDFDGLDKIFSKYNFKSVFHLAAQAGVRFSITNPAEYVNSNLFGFYNLLEVVKKYKISHTIFASSSSVYGNSSKTFFRENQKTDEPVSFYAATKKSNEILAHSYSKLYNLRFTGLRFFTVYGPWGRPDMAPYLFTNGIINNQKIKIFNNGNLERDFTFIDDIIEGINIVFESSSKNNYKIFNIGNGSPVKLLNFVKIIERNLDLNANLKLLPMQNGDVYKTCADIFELKKIGYNPKISIDEGMNRYINWFLKYYKIEG